MAKTQRTAEYSEVRALTFHNETLTNLHSKLELKMAKNKNQERDRERKRERESRNENLERERQRLKNSIWSRKWPGLVMEASRSMTLETRKELMTAAGNRCSPPLELSPPGVVAAATGVIGFRQKPPCAPPHSLSLYICVRRKLLICAFFFLFFFVFFFLSCLIGLVESVVVNILITQFSHKLVKCYIANYAMTLK